jgi:rhodanese-related sulfurtransferase
MEESFFSGGFISAGIMNVTPHQAFSLCQKGAVLIDVREEELSRFKMFGVPEVIYCPSSMLDETYEQLPKDKPMIIADAAGLHSKGGGGPSHGERTCRQNSQPCRRTC